MKYLSALIMVRNEDPLYVEEWARHHFDLGVEHIYFLNHTPNPIPIPRMDNTTIWDVGPARRQAKYYWDAFKNVDSHWTAVIDADEFIICKGKLPELLEQYDQFDALAMNWLMFGSSNHDKKVYPIKENYHWRTPCTYGYNISIKSIVKPKNVKCRGSVHFFGGHVVNEQYDVINGAEEAKHGKPFSGNKIRANHYFTRSREDWRQRMSRGRADCNLREISWERFNETNAASSIYDLQPTQIHGYQELSGKLVIPLM